jgi:hypothetical protein
LHSLADSTKAGAGQWVRPRDAVYPDESVRQDPALLQALLKDGLVVVQTPEVRYSTRETRTNPTRTDLTRPDLF